MPNSREASASKNGKIWEKFPKSLDPPSPSEISDFFEFQTFLKIADPPSRIKFRHFGFSDISYKGDIANFTIK